jgi:hypothetical protein
MPHCVRRSAGVFLIGLLLLAITAAAGPLFSQAQQFNARTEVVLVDVSVLDQKRQPVRGLTAADFTVFEDGKPQAVEYFSPALVDPPAEHAPA